MYANFEDTGVPFESFFAGPFRDYSSKWYAIVGARITETMAINACLPPVIEAIPIIQAWFFQRLD